MTQLEREAIIMAHLEREATTMTQLEKEVTTMTQLEKEVTTKIPITPQVRNTESPDNPLDNPPLFPPPDLHNPASSHSSQLKDPSTA